MVRVAARDYEKILGSLQSLYACGDFDALHQRIVEQVTGLIPAELITLTDIDTVHRRGRVALTPYDDVVPRLMPVFERYVHQHPVVNHFKDTNDPRPLAISDFLSTAELHRLGLYNELYREFRVEDQLSIGLQSTDGVVIGLSVNRTRRGFSRRDREVLRLLRPHLMQVRRNAAVMSRLRAHAAASDAVLDRLPHGVVSLDPSGKPTRVTAPARHLLDRYFPAHRPGAQTLPDDLRRWSRAQRANRETRLAPHQTFTKEHDGRRLVARLSVSPDGQSVIVLQEEALATPSADVLRQLGLTDREAEVVHWVIEGKTNPQIGLILSISARTVQKHLERVFKKLGVETRAALVVRALEGKNSR